MNKPSRDEILKLAGEPVAIVYVREEKTPSEHGRFTSWLINPVGIHNGTKLYTEAQLLAVAAPAAESAKSEGWRQCAVGQHTSQFCGQLEAEKAKAYAAGEEGMRKRAVNILRNRISAVMAADEIAALPITPATGEQA